MPEHNLVKGKPLIVLSMLYRQGSSLKLLWPLSVKLSWNQGVFLSWRGSIGCASTPASHGSFNGGTEIRHIGRWSRRGNDHWSSDCQSKEDQCIASYSYSSIRIPTISGYVASITPGWYIKGPTQPTHATSPKEEGYRRDRMAEGNTHTKSTVGMLGRSWNSKGMI